MVVSTREKTKRICEALPKMDCGLCGFDSCAKYARAVAMGKASPFGCRQDLWAGYAISRIVGASIHGELASVASPGFSSSREALGQDVQRLSNKVEDILTRIEKLRARKQ
jgi:hypothetical protein